MTIQGSGSLDVVHAQKVLDTPLHQTWDGGMNIIIHAAPRNSELLNEVALQKGFDSDYIKS